MQFLISFVKNSVFDDIDMTNSPHSRLKSPYDLRILHENSAKEAMKSK